MLKFLIGPALMGAGYAAGSYYGADAEQLVHKSPSVTYAGLEQALANMRTSGTTSFEGGTPVPYEIKVDRTLDQKLVVHLLFAGKQGAEADIDLTPADGGNSTLVYFMCDDLDATMATLASRGAHCSEPFAASWGRATSVPLPGGGKIGVYEPRHARP